MTARDDKEKDKMSRENLGKFFYDLAKATFIAMVIGGILNFFSDDYQVGKTIGLFITGIFVTTVFSVVAFKIIKS
jgi:hypothetical protein